MKDIEDLKFMSLGGNCADIGYLGNQRIHGPVDNMRAINGLASGVTLIKNCDKVYEELISDTPKETLVDGLKVFNTYGVRHNDNSTEKFRGELKRRMDVFKDFLSHIRDDDKYFVYTLNMFDVYRPRWHNSFHLRNLFINAIDDLRKMGLLNKLIIVGTQHEDFFAEETFAKYNCDEVSLIPDVNYVLLKNIGLKQKELKEDAHRQFIQKIKKIINTNKPNIQNLEFMSIGGNCADLWYLGDQRIHGPVDNMFARNGLASSLSLFDGSFKKIVDNNLRTQDGNITVFGDFNIAHGDPNTDKFLSEFQRRTQTLDNFLKEVNTDPKKYITYSLNYNDVIWDKNKFKFILAPKFKENLNRLLNYISIDKLIIVGCISEASFNVSWSQYNCDDIKQIPNLKYIICKNVGMGLEDERISYVHSQFVTQLKNLI